MWEQLSVMRKSGINDIHRPTDLPRDKTTVGKPRQRTAKPRAANPFRRKRVIKLQKVIYIYKMMIGRCKFTENIMVH
jgi:hypothetical protein